jgi:Uma2 family endonuclease
MTETTVYARRWSRAEYEQMIAKGLFRPDDRLELLDGVLIVREPQHDRHALAIRRVDAALRPHFGTGWLLAMQLPLALDEMSEPEPDFSIVRGSLDELRQGHPRHAALIVEVAESSLGIDRGRKATLYARAGIPDYWIVNLVGRTLEIHREPVAAPETAAGWHYARSALSGPARRSHPSPRPEPESPSPTSCPSR